ncbi:claspin [Patella vulgata]|uniref:claspin n=1 Tax=Patella vulgata TaxID=6465 RepID=UPI0024A8E8C9|nr:claspin [Patella vulgata]
MVGVIIEERGEHEASKTSDVKGDCDFNDKTDSGMDDESVKTDSPLAADSDSEDEVIVTKKPKKKMIMEDSDDEDDDSNKKTESLKDNDEENSNDTEKFRKTKSANEVLDEVMNDINNSDTVESESETDLNTEVKASEDITDRKSEKLVFDSDIFDAEESSDDEKDKKENDSNSESSDGEQDQGDEGFDEDNLDPKLLAKLKKLKGAGKQLTRESKQRKAKDAALSIHSESQRILRESGVNLPYHQPAPKSLNDFLARASKKQAQYKCLKSIRDNKNAKVIEETLSEKKEPVTTQMSPKPSSSKINTSFDDLSITETSNKSEQKTEQTTVNPSEASETLLTFDSGDELPDISGELPIKPIRKTSDAVSPKLISNSNLETTDMTNSAIIDKNTNNVDSMDFSSDCLKDDSDDEVDKVTKSSTKKECSEENVISNTESNNVVSKTPKQLILSRLNLSMEDMPKLSGDTDSIIVFEEENVTPKNPELCKFMDRFMEHSKKKKKIKSKDVDISIIQKESDGINKEELKLNSFTYHIEEEEPVTPDCEVPGAKLLSLKEKLQAAMKVKREESRQKRQEMYALENEEGFDVSGDEEAILDDDAEMTDGSDTDVEDDEFDKQFGDAEFDDEEQVENPFADDEAEEDNDDGGEETMKLQLDTSDEEDDEPIKTYRSQKIAVISDEEESRDAGIQNIDPNDDDDNEDVEAAELSPLSKHLNSHTPKVSRMRSLTMPIENTQDLYDDTQDIYPTDTQPSQSLNFLLEDSQSQMLDADGFLKVRSSSKQATRRSLGVEDDIPNNTQDNMDELLGLCSGRFAATQNNKTSSKSLFDNDVQPTQDGGNMDELLGLCSGVFAATGVEKSQGTKRKLEDDDDDDDEDSNMSLKLLSEDEDDDIKKPDEGSDKDVNNDGDSKKMENNSDSDEDVSNIIIKSKKKKGFKNKFGKLRAEFVDEEAELSGSEYESDEDLDIDEDDDILMEEEGDKDNPINETELRDQVGRAHLKQVIDEDKRELMRFQEMYLPDGDLHTEGAGRMRRFRWSNMDDESQQDMFGQDSDAEGEDGDEEATEELKWRMERFKREKFLEEQKENEEKVEEESQGEESQIMKFGKCFLQKKDPVGSKNPLQKSVSLPVNSSKTIEPTFVKPSLKSTKRGSFLNRSKEALAKIAIHTKAKMNPNATKHSRNFVFQVISPEKDKPEPQLPLPKTTPKSVVKKPPAKRQKLASKPTKNNTSSIFKLLEK